MRIKKRNSQDNSENEVGKYTKEQLHPNLVNIRHELSIKYVI